MTQVTVDFYKYTGKHYTSFQYYSDFYAWQMQEINNEVKKMPSFIKGMNYTIEVDTMDKGWNKVLFLVPNA